MTPRECERFLAFVRFEGECWIWTGAKNRKGYGQFTAKIDGRWRNIAAHRWAYKAWVGPVADGVPLDHYVCDAPGCANPWHVRPATHRENILRGRSRQAENAAKTKCVNGHPFDADNTYVNPKNGRRACRACGRACFHRSKARRG